MALVLFFGLIILSPREGYAYPITLTFKTATGQAAPNVKIRGSRGINALTLLTSDAEGNWTFDTNALTGLDGIIVFSGVNTGVQLIPSEVKVSELVAQGVRSKLIRATPSAQPSTIVSWSFYSSGTTPLRNQPVSLLNPQSLSCEQRFTDENGYVAWSVMRPKSKCDDLSDETGWLQIVPHEAPGTRCSLFSTYRTVGMKSCPLTGDDEAGVSAASCTVVTNPAPSLSSRIQVSIQSAGTAFGVQGVELIGNSNLMALPSRFTDNNGNFSFTIGSIPGASATTAFEIAPIANGYEFIPRKRDSRECAFAGNNTYTCKFSAIRTFSPQGALLLDVTQAEQPLSGVSMVQPMAGLGCMDPAARFSDWKGKVVFPVRKRSACPTLPDSPAWLAPVSVHPALSGKRFTSSADFQYCPTQLLTTASIQAYDESSGVQNYSITGRVVALDGGAFGGVSIFMNGQEASRTGADGRFEIFPIVQGTSAKIEARLSPYAFDPEFETFSSVGQNIETTIVARSPDPLGGIIEPPQESCPVKTDYTLRGRVLDRSGMPIRGARIHNNNQEESTATTDANGYFSLLAAFGSDNWVTVEHEAALFSPAGRSLVETVCDDDTLDFQQVDFESTTVSGRVVVADVAGLSDLPMRVLVNGVPLGFDIRTAQDGSFMFTAPLGAELQIVPDSTRYDFNPSKIGPLTVEAGVSGILFSASPIPIVNPPSAPTLAPTVGQPPPTTVPLFPPTITAIPSSAPPGVPPVAQPPATTATSAPTATPQPQEPTLAPSTPAPPSLIPGEPQPTTPPSQTSIPPREPVVTSVPMPSVEPTSPPVAAPTSPPAAPPTSPPVAAPTSPPVAAPTSPPAAPPIQTPQATAIPVATVTAIPTQPPISTAAPLPMLVVAARCGLDAKAYDWVFANIGTVPIENARWRVFDAAQPSVGFEGDIFSLAPSEKMEVLNTPRLDISPRFYRLAVYITDSLGRQITLAVEPWELVRCMHGLPTPEPTLSPTLSPPTVPTTPDTNTPVATPAPGVTPVPVENTAIPVPVNPIPPVSTQPGGAPIISPPPIMTAPPTLTPTPTATPTPQFEIHVETRHWRNGRRMTGELFNQLASGGFLVVRGRAGTAFERWIPLSEFLQPAFDYTTFVPAGSYRIGFSGVRVVSVFRRNVASFACTVGLARGARNRCVGIPFALQPLKTAQQTIVRRGRGE